MPAEIVIVDDDPVVGNLTTDILRDAGFSTLWVKDCFQAEHVIRATMPRLAVLDIMMPGLDGISLLKALKGNPTTASIKYLMMSGKSFAADKQRAMDHGADLFLEKPFDVDTFQKTVVGLIGQPRAPVPTASQPKVSTATVKVWGMRAPADDGSGPPGTCVSLETADRVFAFDGGTGLTALGTDLLARAPQKEVWIVLTHAHPGHVYGLKDFAPIATTGRILKLCGPTSPDLPLKDVIKGALTGAKARPQSRFELYELLEETYEIAPGVRLAAMYANHPGTTLALGLELDGKKFVYAADSECAGEAAGAMHDYDEKLARFARGADLLVHDANFTDKDFSAKLGHSNVSAALAVAQSAGVRELWLTHLDAKYSEGQLAEIEAEAALKAERAGFVCRLPRVGFSAEL